jgi:hypothetical protein
VKIYKPRDPSDLNLRNLGLAYVLIALFLIASMLDAPEAGAEESCACMCLHTGEWKTLCTSVDLAAADPTMCSPDGIELRQRQTSSAVDQCPTIELTEFADLPDILSEPEGSENCRWIGLYAGGGKWQPFKVCDPSPTL